MDERDDRLIDIKGSLRSPVQKKLYSFIEPPIERLLSISALNKSWDAFLSTYDQDRNFFDNVLDELGVNYDLSDEDRDRIPTSGPLLVVANHPFGGVDGVVLGAILTSVRSDVKLLANRLLHRIRKLRQWLVSVDPFDNPGSAASNVGALKAAIRWLRQGGALATFPSGTVSHLQFTKGGVADPDWSEHTAALIRRTRATALPVFFEGRNSFLFQVMGLLSPRLRTALLPRELLNKSDRTIKVKIGNPIPFAKLEGYESDKDVVDHLRVRTYIQRNRTTLPAFDQDSPAEETPRTFHYSSDDRQENLVSPVNPSLLQRDVERLEDEHCLVEQNDFAVYIAPAKRIPNILDEIGLLREKTFREVGEGTGRNRDLDRFDEYYEHLFVWNARRREIVGAYRLGLTDTLLSRFGITGLYTSTLFEYKPEFVEHINPGVEMGRSFIRSEYQRKRQSLAMLWRGIGEFVARNPHYKLLFGPVSISREYNPLSKNLMVQFFKANKFNPQFARLVRAKNPPGRKDKKRLGGVNKRILRSALRDTEDVSALISEIEEDSKGIPVLLRHYLKLNGSLLSFNVDKDFARVLDGLIIVDLAETDPRLLKRYMGKEGCASFLEWVENQKAQSAPRHP